MSAGFGLYLFTSDPALVRGAAGAGVDGVVVDLECVGKERRQRGADTQINRDSLDDLRRVRAATRARVLCRVNGPAVASSAAEIEEAVRAGADEVLLPMVRAREEVERALAAVGGRRGLGVLVETVDAVRVARELARLPLARVYVGLNDLAIDRRSGCPFDALADGTVDEVRRAFARSGIPFGVAGLTLPDRGRPIPCRLLVAELARLGASFTFLRRSFLADVRGRELAPAVAELRRALGRAQGRGARAVARDRAELLAAIAAWPGSAAASRRVAEGAAG